MFTFVIWIWLNIFVLFINKIGINTIPKRDGLRILMYVIFPMVFIIEVLPDIVKGGLDKFIRTCIIQFVNLLDKLRGSYE